MESAFWFHIVNVILHILSSILFTRICSNVAGFKRNFSLIAGIFFAVHPIHTESKFTSHKQSSPTPHSSRFFFFSSPLVRCIRNCRTGGTLRMFFILAFVSFVSWVRDGMNSSTLPTIFISDVLLRSHNTKEPSTKELWISIVLGGLAMLAKENCVTVFIVNLIYDFYRNWSTLKKTIQDVRWTQDSYKFATRMFSILASMTIFLLARIALLQGSLPKFSQQDNPAAFHSSLQTVRLAFPSPCQLLTIWFCLQRVLTFLYLSSFNLWLLLCPSQLSHDWQMGSIPLVLSIKDSRNILTVLTISGIIALVYKIYNDLEVRWTASHLTERLCCVWRAFIKCDVHNRLVRHAEK